MWPFRTSLPFPPPGPRLSRPRPALLYALGDVHGCLDALKRLEDRIIADAAGQPGDKLIVMLGDYVDRGPKSAQTIDWLLRPPPDGFERICLRGNHEIWFMKALARPGQCDDWLAWGGAETLHSYGLDPAAFTAAAPRNRLHMLQGVVPEQHFAFLRDLAVQLRMENLLLVHAGIRPGLPIDAQRDEDLTWIREPFLSRPHGQDVLVIHGHTPAMEPVVLPHRICVDTLAFGGGPLTALRLDRTNRPTFLQV